MNNDNRFRDSVELMSNDEVAMQITERMKILNAHVLAAENERKYINVLYDEKTRRMRL